MIVVVVELSHFQLFASIMNKSPRSGERKVLCRIFSRSEGDRYKERSSEGWRG